MRRLLALAGAIGVAIAAPAHARAFSAGAPGLGDPFFPLAGNGGYDVKHYSLALDYQRAGNQLSGRALILARATQDLSSFDLDLRGFHVATVFVDRRPARFSRRGQELTVVPRSPLPRGQPFAVAVAYAGHPKPVIDPDGSLDGWIPTPDGAFVASEPQGAPSWFPANDNPRDKASFDFAITVPRGITAIANGRLVSVRTSAGRTTWRWREDLPMATYLATATNGVFDLRVSHFGRVPLYQAADPAEVAKGALDQLAAEAGVLRFFAGIYGRYPFSSGGGVVDHAPNVGYFLESQTRVQYAGTPDLDSLVHELAHQWFGDAVSLQLWRDIWLNEGFATFSQWYYDERHGGPSAQAAFDQVYAIPADDPFWSTAPAGLPGPEELFSGPVYARGAATLQALRTKVGDRVFFAILRAWYQRYRYGNATTRQFIALAERISGRSLERFFDVWLYEPAKPSRW